MKAIMVQNPAGFDIPAGGIILWYGLAGAVPAGWEIYTELMGYFPRGELSYNATAKGSATHGHTYPSDAVSWQADHTHNMPGGSVSGASGIDCGWGSNSAANMTHNHSVNGSMDPAGGHRHTLANPGSASNLPKHKKYYYIRRLP